MINPPVDRDVLLSCPFCGHEPRYGHDEFFKRHSYACSNVLCDFNPSDNAPNITKQEAIDNWNTRTLPAPVGVEAYKPGNFLTGEVGPPVDWPIPAPTQDTAITDEALKAFEEYCSTLFYVANEQAKHRLHGEWHESGPQATLQKAKERAKKAQDALEPYIETIKAALRLAAAGWHDISTAPKGFYPYVEPIVIRTIANDKHVVFRYEDGLFYTYGFGCKVLTPTHWMPLPKGPTPLDAIKSALEGEE